MLTNEEIQDVEDLIENNISIGEFYEKNLVSDWRELQVQVRLCANKMHQELAALAKKACSLEAQVTDLQDLLKVEHDERVRLEERLKFAQAELKDVIEAYTGSD